MPFGSVNLNPGTFELFAWTRDFNSACQYNTYAHVWVRFFGIPQEYWRPRIIFAISTSIGTPIRIDNASLKSKFDRTFRQFIQVLVNMDGSFTTVESQHPGQTYDICVLL